MATAERNTMMLDLSMNATEFRSYLTHRYLEEIAHLICVELQCFVPISLASFTTRQSLKSHIKKSLPNISEQSRKLFCTLTKENGDTKYEMSSAVLNLIEVLRKELNCLLITAKRQNRLNFGETSTSDSTSSYDELTLQERKKRRTDDYISTKQYRDGQLPSSLTTSSDQSQASFSDDESVPPPILFTPMNTESSLIYQIYTSRRIDYFCKKHLGLSSIADIRQLELSAKTRLKMHQENFYEFLQYVRNNDELLKQVKHVIDKPEPNQTMQIQRIIDQLQVIKMMTRFVSRFGF